MNCPICSTDSRVLHVYPDYRRRECLKCFYRFNTTEVLIVDKERMEQIVEKAKDLVKQIKEIA